jgi:hypothetical protein
MSDVQDDPITAKVPRHTRRLSDKILVAFHHACDQGDFEVADRLLKVLEFMIDTPRPPPGRERRNKASLVAAYERLWHLRHPDPELNLEPR